MGSAGRGSCAAAPADSADGALLTRKSEFGRRVRCQGLGWVGLDSLSGLNGSARRNGVLLGCVFSTQKKKTWVRIGFSSRKKYAKSAYGGQAPRSPFFRKNTISTPKKI